VQRLIGFPDALRIDYLLLLCCLLSADSNRNCNCKCNPVNLELYEPIGGNPGYHSQNRVLTELIN
jgi:hypothetical protein